MNYFLFDIGNVLVDFDDADLLDVVKKSTRHPRDTATAREPELDDLVEKGHISDEEYVKRLNQAKGLDWSVEELTQVWSSIFRLNTAGRRLYSEVVESGVGVCMLSNIAGFHINAIRHNWPDFFDGADSVFLSYQVGIRKPHPGIYRHVLDELDAQGNQCFFIDDLPQNVEAARSFGIHAHQYLPETQDSVRDEASRFFGW